MPVRRRDFQDLDPGPLQLTLEAGVLHGQVRRRRPRHLSGGPATHRQRIALVELPSPPPELALMHADLCRDLKEAQPTRLNALHSLPLELIREIPALLLLYRTLLCSSKDLSQVSTQAGQDQLNWPHFDRTPRLEQEA
jgi:hypothetical protein